MYSRDEQIEIANEIQRQLGGSRFRIMTGAKHLMAHEAGLSFKIPGTMTKNHINYIKITLDPSDTYTMEFWSYRGMKGKKISEREMVYNDMLQDIFTNETGLKTSL
jgi:hypothetical protein